jgi:C-terminal processing protease CtpA/Prc
VQTFGRPTYGLTTGNVMTALPDGATVLLTTTRFAFGTGKPLRGPLVPDVEADKGTTPAATLEQAAAWAAGACSR